MIRNTGLILLCLGLIIYSCTTSTENLKTGSWQGFLHLYDNIELPFLLNVDKNTANYEIAVFNGKEKIQLLFDFEQSSNTDSLVYVFDVFHTYLIFTIVDNEKISGYWVNNDRKNHSRIPFQAIFGQPKLTSTVPLEITGSWEVYFDYKDEKNTYPAVGKFSQSTNSEYTIDGTFLTETGDYRFLTGQAIDDVLTLSCFDGSHAFLFIADVFNDSINGVFYSGSHWQTEWYGVKNDTFVLTNPYELTYITNNEPLRFQKNNFAGKRVNYPSSAFSNKVIILQLFGSWCPNCLDETLFFNELYEKYSDDGLEIIGIGYELPEKEEDQLIRLQKYKERLNIKYPLLLGGKASKQAASEDFPMVNAISSFPTTFFIDREGNIVKIHTGFNGPGTGEVYEHYTQEVEKLIEHLIKL